MKHFRLASIVGFAILASIAGCQRGPALGMVRGTVRVNGQPLPFAYVVFQPIDPPGAYGSAYADEDGEYELQFSRNRAGAPVGKHQVSIRAAGGEELPDDASRQARIVIPERYNSTTELIREVKSGSNVHDFDLEVPAALSSTSS